MALPRLRQVVLAATDLGATSAAIEAALGAAAPFHDEGVAHFGLHNAVYALGDTFLEVVSPLRDATAAGRYMQRRGGDCGYMAMFQVPDATVTRRRIADLGVRVVWDTTHDDIVDLHLHPKDVPGAIVALDVVDPPGSWRWGGPAWTATVPEHGPGGVVGMTVAAVDPAATARRWASVLALDEPRDSALSLAGGMQEVRFVQARDERAEGIVGVRVALPGDPGGATIAGVRFERVTAED